MSTRRFKGRSRLPRFPGVPSPSRSVVERGHSISTTNAFRPSWEQESSRPIANALQHACADRPKRRIPISVAAAVAGVLAANAASAGTPTTSVCQALPAQQTQLPTAWQLVSRLPGFEASGVAPLTACTAIVVGTHLNGPRGAGSILIVTRDSGSPIKRAIIPPGSAQLRAIAVQGRSAWAVGANGNGRGLVFESQDRGLHWRRVSRTPFGAPLRGVSFIDQRHGWVVDGRTIYDTTNGGVTWHPQAPPRGMTFVADVSFRDQQDGTAVGSTVAGAAVATTTDGGAKWRLSYSGSSGAFFRVTQGAQCTIAAGNDTAGSTGLLALSRRASSWQSVSPPPGAEEASGVWCSFAGEAAVVRDGINTAIFTRLGQHRWTRARTPTVLGTGQLVFGYERWWLAGDGGVSTSPVVR